MEVEEPGAMETEHDLSISTPLVSVSDPSVLITFPYLLYALAHGSTTQDCEFLEMSSSHSVTILHPTPK
jgi:hypothetical protein